MTIRIPVSAEPSAALAAFRQIQDAINRAGQAGRDFGQINLGHPELAGMARDLERIHQRAMDLARLGRGSTAAAWRAAGGAAAAAHPVDLHGAMERVAARYADPREAARVQGQAARYILAGTQWAAPPPLPSGYQGGSNGQPVPAAGQGGFWNGYQQGLAQGRHGATGGGSSGGGGGSGGGNSGGAGFARRLGMQVGGIVTRVSRGPVGLALSLAGVSRVSSMISEGVHSAQDESIENSRTMRRLGDLEPDFFKLRDALRGTTDTLGITRREGQQLAQTFARAAWSTDTRATTRGIEYGARFARGFGLDNAYAVQAFGHADRNMIDPKQFGAVVADAVQSGNMGGKTEEVMDALLRWSDTASRQMVVGNNSFRDFAAMYSGLNNLGMPGLRGQNAEATIGQMNAALSQGGGFGLASQYFTARAFARHGVTDPYRQAYIQEGGMFARMSDAGGRDNTTVFDAQMELFREQYAGQDPFLVDDAMHNHFGISRRAARAIRENYKPGQVGQTEDALKAAGLSLRDVRPDALGDIGRMLNGGDLGAMRTKLLERAGRGEISADDAAKLRDASPDKLQDIIVTTLAKYGSDKTQGERVMESQNRLASALNDNMSRLVTPLTDLQEGLGRQLAAINRNTDEMEKLVERVFGRNAISDPFQPLYDAMAPLFRTFGLEPPHPTTGVNPDGTPATPGSGQSGEAGGGFFGTMHRGVAALQRAFGGTATAALSTPEQEANARTSYEYFTRERGWSHERALGALGDISRESGFNPRSHALTSQEDSRGIGQWNAERRAAFRARYGMEPNDAPLALQLEFYADEIDGRARNHRDAGSERAGQATAGQVSRDDAARAMVELRSRPAPENRARDIARSQAEAAAWERRLRRPAAPAAPAAVRLGPAAEQRDGLPAEPAPQEPDLTRGGRALSTGVPEPMFPAPDNPVGRDVYNRALDALRRGAGSTPGADGVAPPPLEMQAPSPGTIPGATPVPDDDGSAAPRQEASLSFAPLRVVHETPTGQIIREEVLPPTMVRRPVPLGLG